MLSFCIGSISCCFVVLLFHCCFSCSAILWYSDCSVRVLLFSQCSGVPTLLVFRCSVQCSTVPCPVALCPGVLVLQYALQTQQFQSASQMYNIGQLPAEETHQQGSRGRGNSIVSSIESEGGREAGWRRTNQEKESRLKKKAKRKQTVEVAQKEQKHRSRKLAGGVA